MTDTNQVIQGAVAAGVSLAVLGVGLNVLNKSINQTQQPRRRKLMRKNPLYG